MDVKNVADKKLAVVKEELTIANEALVRLEAERNAEEKRLKEEMHGLQEQLLNTRIKTKDDIPEGSVDPSTTASLIVVIHDLYKECRPFDTSTLQETAGPEDEEPLWYEDTNREGNWFQEMRIFFAKMQAARDNGRVLDLVVDNELDQNDFPYTINGPDDFNIGPDLTPYDLKYVRFLNTASLASYEVPPLPTTGDLATFPPVLPLEVLPSGQTKVKKRTHTDWTTGESASAGFNKAVPAFRWFRNAAGQANLRYDAKSRTGSTTIEFWQIIPLNASFSGARSSRARQTEHMVQRGPAIRALTRIGA